MKTNVSVTLGWPLLLARFFAGLVVSAGQKFNAVGRTWQPKYGLSGAFKPRAQVLKVGPATKPGKAPANWLVTALISC